MTMFEIITDKKFGRELTRGQIEFFIKGAADGSIKEYHLAALLMALRLNGMTDRELLDMTLAMARSGTMLNLDPIGVPCVDKHSTGGVGDTTTLILAPLVAACGVPVCKLSGRGLAHTGGTVDKLESIPGMRMQLTSKEMLDCLGKVGCVIAGQSGDMAPADKTLYALRDVTSTVDSIPLIASSVMSKKIAGGAHGIVLDVKTGSGAVIQDIQGSIKLAEAMVSIGANAGKNVIALVTSMSQPLGTHIGNALEVKEAIDILSGHAAGDLRQVSLRLGSYMLLAAGKTGTLEEAEVLLRRALADGSGLAKLEEIIGAQGGDARVCRDTRLLPAAPCVQAFYCRAGGYMGRMDTEKLGLCAMSLGAGRATAEGTIDPSVGFVLHRRAGDAVSKGDALFTVHAADALKLHEAAETLFNIVPIVSERPAPEKLIDAVVDASGVRLC